MGYRNPELDLLPRGLPCECAHELGGHGSIDGSTDRCLNCACVDFRPARCVPAQGYHSTPHRGCVLR